LTVIVSRRLKDYILGVPALGPLARRIGRKRHDSPFTTSGSYWESRYREGGSSGVGSYGALGQFKAEVINTFVAEHQVATVIELGCGDGAQLRLARYPSYVGVDVSPTVVARCEKEFAVDGTKRFFLLAEADHYRGTYDLALSLDVVYHLIEDDVYKDHMQALFTLANRHVIIYGSNADRAGQVAHVRHRNVTAWVAANARRWTQIDFVQNRYPFDPGRPGDTSFADFYFFGRRHA
jgi:hypothetical protein